MKQRSTTHGRLSKSLGVVRLSLYGVGTIIGAGIYSVIAPAAAAAGDALWVSFLVAAAISALSGLSYAELASALPSAGAEHSFLREALPKAPAVAFAVGLFIAVHGAATLATVALTFGNYLQTFLASNAAAVALALMALATLVNIAGVSKASLVSAILTVLQVSCLLAFAGFAIGGGGGNVVTRLTFPDNWSGVLQGAAILFFIYSGYEHMATMSEEAKNPARDLWRAFMAALLVTTFVYLLVALSVLALMDAREIQASAFPLAAAAGRLSGGLGAVIAAAALLATANAVLSASLSGSRLLFGMARSGDLPGALRRTTKRKSPWVGALVFLGTACLFAIFGEIEFVASLSSLGVTLVFASVNAAVIVLRFARPDLERPFRLPSIGGVPPTAVLGVVCSLALSTQYGWTVYAAFIAAFMVGAVPYMWIRRRGSKS
jgi:APA family basic amino acid/polyamine antiporter